MRSFRLKMMKDCGYNVQLHYVHMCMLFYKLKLKVHKSQETQRPLQRVDLRAVYAKLRLGIISCLEYFRRDQKRIVAKEIVFIKCCISEICQTVPFPRIITHCYVLLVVQFITEYRFLELTSPSNKSIMDFKPKVWCSVFDLNLQYGNLVTKRVCKRVLCFQCHVITEYDISYFHRNGFWGWQAYAQQ